MSKEKSLIPPMYSSYFEDLGEYDYSVEIGAQLRLPDMNRDGFVGARSREK
ncbi:MAG: hypothetical protein ABH864_06925 [archaeon]